MTMHALLAAAALAVASQATAQVVFYEHDNFRGRSFAVDRSVSDFSRSGFNDLASSAIVRGGSWEACEDARFRGRCIVLRPGRYRSLGAMGFNDRISSVRPTDARFGRREERRGPPYDDRSVPRRSEPGNEAGM